jgi:broad specificity phosphatase PhoE
MAKNIKAVTRKKTVRSKAAPRKKVPHPPATRLLLIRHGEVEARYQGIFGGRIDMNLSPRGKQQAKILAEYLRVKTIDAVYASPMKRVQQTLAPTLKLHGHSQTIFHDLREIDFGDWTGLNWAMVQDKYDFAVHEWLLRIEDPGAPNGESGQSFRARLEPVLREIIRKHPGENIAIFCHGGVIRALLAILLDIPLPKTNSFEVEYASITQVALHPHLAEIELLNFTPWRDLVG